LRYCESDPNAPPLRLQAQYRCALKHMARPVLTTQQRSDQDRRQHRQLLRGMAECVATKGYPATTIADVVRAARVSKSTFYAHFADKEACYLALYSAAVNNVLAAMREADAAASDAALPWREHLSAVNAAYLAELAGGGGVTRSLLVDIQTVGPAAVAKRREIFDRYVRLMRGVCAGLRTSAPELNAVSEHLALGVVGGVNEVVAHAIEARGVAAVAGLGDVATDLWAAVLTAGALGDRAPERVPARVRVRRR
jgi:AcrR family transcriptional regulator